MTNPKDGGPAFPTPPLKEARYNEFGGSYESPTGVAPGMSLRDWMAGMVLQGLLASGWSGTNGYHCVAVIAYKAADAMLSQREEEL